jgi:hypothetical protein
MAGVIWGDAKVGKTTYAMSLPGKKLLINLDPDGFVSVQHRDDLDILDLSQLPPQEAINDARKAASFIVENGANYNSVVVDSLTTLAEAALLDAIHRRVGKSATFTPSIDAPGLSAYGARNQNFNDVVARILRATTRHGLHCFFLAHADDPEFDQDGKTVVQQTIMLSSKMRQTTGLKVSEIWHMTMSQQNRRTLYLAPFGIKRPMGSRIFDTAKVPKFDLHYDINIPDDEQPHSLAHIYKTWTDGKMRKLTAVPTK